MVQLSHGPEVLTPTFVGRIHPPLPSKDRSPLSRALNPPPSAPLQHINSGTGTNCPTLDVLETQIASAASAATNPPTLHPEQKKPLKRRIAKLLVPLPSSLVKHSASPQRASFISLCYCKCASIQPCCENITLPSCAALPIFVPPFRDGLVSLLFLRED